MRKKVFIIHGKGVNNGLGKESGGDLDTVASNAFYGAWIEHKLSENGGAVYGEDYEYDFANYQQGFRHLDIHEGCDLYLPDFPIDAMSPRLEMRKIRREAEIDVRVELYDDSDALRRLFYGNRRRLPQEWKDKYNDLVYRSDKIRGDRQFYEIQALREYTGFFLGVGEQVVEEGKTGEAISLIAEKMFGKEFEELRDNLVDQMDSYLKRNLVEDIPQQNVRPRLMLDDSARSDYGSLFRTRAAGQLLEVWVEAISVIVSTYFLAHNLENDLPENGRKDLLEWTESLREPIAEYTDELQGLLKKILESNPGNDHIERAYHHAESMSEFWDSLSFEQVITDYQPLEDVLAVQILEESSGRPISDLEVVFNVNKGDVSLAPFDEPEQKVQSLGLPTNQKGVAAVHFYNPNNDGDFGVTATYNEMHFATFPEELTLTKEYFEEHPDPASIELRLVEYLSGEESVQEDSVNLEKIEQGENVENERAQNVQCELLESDLRYLAEQDVRLMRIDDHHPYTPAILETLEDLVEDGVIEQEIRLSSLPRGQHQPKEKQLCGADLVYSKFIEGTGADNEGLEALKNEAHLQDLHIEESYLAIELSKLIGSKYNKIEMARGLKDVGSAEEFDDVLATHGWDLAVQKYEDGLEKVLPRVEKTLYRVDFILPPDDGEYASKVGLKRYLHPVEMLFGTKEEKQQLYRELYTRQEDRRVRTYVALSPFCDPEKGEPSINVASAINYLTQRYTMDYYFYAYGTFLFSTRRVNEEGYPIDLSRLVSKIGSPADGGHAAAATGSPESNPNFPAERFEKVNDQNFAEYLYYISDIIQDHTDLERLELAETFPDEFEPGMVEVLERLDRNVYNVRLRGGEGVANICVVKGVYTDDDEPRFSVPAGIAYLQKKYPMDYCFFSISPSNLVMRNVSDPAEILNLDRVARTLGTFRDGGHPRAASCQPRFHPDFDEASYKYVNNDNMEEYVKYLGKRIWDRFEFDSVDVSSYQ